MSKWQLEKINYSGKEIVFPKKIIADVEDKDEKTLFSILESVVEEWKKDNEILNSLSRYIVRSEHCWGQSEGFANSFDLEKLVEYYYGEEDNGKNHDYVVVDNWVKELEKDWRNKKLFRKEDKE